MKKIKFLVTFFILINSIEAYSKVLIITHAFLRPDFIEIQYHTFKRFMLDDYEFVVFNDARDSLIRNQIKQMCTIYHLQCIEIAQEIHDRPYLDRTGSSSASYNHSAVRCANVVQYSLDILGFYHDGIVMIIDSDMFLIREFSIINYLKGYDIAGHCQRREHIEYIWNGLIFFDMQNLPNKHNLNFNCGWVDGILADVGGYTHYYFKQNPQVKLRYFGNPLYVQDFWCQSCTQNNQFCYHKIDKMQDHGFSNPLIELATHSPQSIMEIFLENTFLHYRAGGNWNNESAEYHERKTKLLNNFFEKLLNK